MYYLIAVVSDDKIKLLGEMTLVNNKFTLNDPLEEGVIIRSFSVLDMNEPRVICFSSYAGFTEIRKGEKVEMNLPIIRPFVIDHTAKL